MNKFLFCVFLLIFSYSVHATNNDACDLLRRQYDLSTAQERQNLVNYGIGEIMESRDTPRLIISEKLIPDCEARWVATRYVSDKLFLDEFYDKKKYRVSHREFRLHKRVICMVIMTINRQGYRWLESGMTGTIKGPLHKLVTEELMPEWEEFLLITFSEGRLDLNYFTESTFAYPNPKLKPFIERDLQNGKDWPATGIIFCYFLKKNMGEKLDLSILEADWRRRKRSGIGYEHIDKNEVFAEALKLLKKKGQISFKEARKFKDQYVTIF